MKSNFKSVLLVGALGLASAVTGQAGYIYVGSWDLGNLDGNYGNPNNPYLWYNNPTVYSGVEAAAHLFGGSPSDYAISTIDNTVANINHLAFLDGWGDDQYLYDPQSETFKLDSGAPGYNDPVGGPSYSALVTDHATGGSFINYVFRSDTNSVPDSGWTFGLLGISLGSLAVMRRQLKLV